MYTSQENYDGICFEVEIDLTCIYYINADGIERWMHAQAVLYLWKAAGLVIPTHESISRVGKEWKE